jgi:CDP-diglyceride synthetase
MKKLYPLSILALPALVSAATGVHDILNTIQSIIQAIIPIVIGLAVLMFLWGIAQYIVAKDSDKQKDARMIIIYGVIVLFAMVAIWGLVDVLASTFGIDSGAAPMAPSIPTIRY